MSRLLVFLAIGCALAATVIGFQWPFDGGDHYDGWLAASLLAYFVSLVVDR